MTTTAAGDRIAAAFSGHGARAALMPYLMGGHPDVETSRLACEAAADAGAAMLELGVPFSDPLADGPVIHAAGTRGAARGRHARATCWACARRRRRGCRWC